MSHEAVTIGLSALTGLMKILEKVSIIRRRVSTLPWLEEYEMVNAEALPQMNKEATLR